MTPKEIAKLITEDPDIPQQPISEPIQISNFYHTRKGSSLNQVLATGLSTGRSKHHLGDVIFLSFMPESCKAWSTTYSMEDPICYTLDPSAVFPIRMWKWDFEEQYCQAREGYPDDSNSVKLRSLPEMIKYLKYLVSNNVDIYEHETNEILVTHEIPPEAIINYTVL